MKGTLDEMRDEQRPWVYADVPVFTKPIKQNQNLVWGIDVNFNLHNIGHLPAMYVFTWLDSPIPIVDPFKAVEEYQRRQCSDGRREPSSSFGDTIFPDQHLNHEIQAGIWEKDWIDAWSASQPNPAWGIPKPGPNPYLIGCVSYQFPGDDAVHFTKFAYVVNWEGHRAYPYDLSTVPITEVKMYPLTTKGYFGAD